VFDFRLDRYRQAANFQGFKHSVCAAENWGIVARVDVGKMPRQRIVFTKDHVGKAAPVKASFAGISVGLARVTSIVPASEGLPSLSRTPWVKSNSSRASSESEAGQARKHA
jgi:hypothetical protein